MHWGQGVMDGTPCAIEGELVASKLAGRMEDTLQALAVRAACSIGEFDGPPPAPRRGGND